MKNNIQVFPSTELNGDGTFYQQHEGMCLRDYFANSAMQALLSNQEMFIEVLKNSHIDISANEAISKAAFSLSDAMLKQREL